MRRSRSEPAQRTSRALAAFADSDPDDDWLPVGSATAEDPPLIFAGEGRAGPLTFPPAEPPPAA